MRQKGEVTFMAIVIITMKLNINEKSSFEVLRSQRVFSLRVNDAY